MSLTEGLACTAIVPGIIVALVLRSSPRYRPSQPDGATDTEYEPEERFRQLLICHQLVEQHLQ